MFVVQQILNVSARPAGNSARVGLVTLYDTSIRPDEDITDWFSDMDPGAGPEVLGMMNQRTEDDTQFRAQMHSSTFQFLSYISQATKRLARNSQSDSAVKR
jgi:hypothetical protein